MLCTIGYENDTMHVHKAQLSIDNALCIGAVPPLLEYVIDNDLIK